MSTTSPEYNAQAQLESEHPESLEKLLELARWEWAEANRCLDVLEEKAASVIQFCGVSAAVLAAVSTQLNLPGGFWILTLLGHFAAMIFSIAVRQPVSRPFMPSPADIAGLLPTYGDYPIRFRLIQKFAESVEEIRRLQTIKAGHLRNAMYCWAGGILLLVFGLLWRLFW